jgi:hypothetical protein
MILEGRLSVCIRILELFLFLPEFIKKGKVTATIEVTLKNTGHLNYEREQYGDHIIVRRRFDATGRGTYEIKSEEGTGLSFPLLFLHLRYWMLSTRNLLSLNN